MTASAPAVSVITPAYNEERYLPDMLRSLQEQTLSDWELLLVDDGSEDQTPEIIEQWSAKDPRVKAVSLRTRLGKVRAFNTAYAASTGRVICHVGADDILPPRSLEIRAEGLADAPELAVHLAKLQIIDADERIVSPPFPRGSQGSQTGSGFTMTRPLADLLFPVPETLPSEDIWLGNGALGCAEKVTHSPETVVHYRIHGGNSNPRHRPFAEMNEAMHTRAEALTLLTGSALPLSPDFREQLKRRTEAEQMRHTGAWLRLLLSAQLPVVDRLALVSMSRPAAWRLRQRLGLLATGWRRR